MTDRYRQALEDLRERCAQEAERITARRRTVAALSNNEAMKPCEVAAAIRKIDVQQYCECAAREIERLAEALRDAATSMQTIADKAGRDEYLMTTDEVRGYANSRANAARAALEQEAGRG